MNQTFRFLKPKKARSFRTLCEEMAQELATLFEKKQEAIEQAFRNTNLPDQGWELSDVTQCFYTNMYRGARTLLQERGQLTSRKKHANGAEWIFWAEEREE